MDDLLLEIRVACHAPISVRGETKDIVMIPFDGVASGPSFTGRTLGPGVDTQTVSKDGEAFLSARYMLEGADKEGRPCRIFIENQGRWGGGFRPRIVTDSPLLRAWEALPLRATVESVPGGVTVRIFRERE